VSGAMSDLALHIIGLSEEEQAHIQAVTDCLAADPGLRSRLEAAERAGVGDGLPPLFRTGLAWARLVRDGGAPSELQRAVAFKDVTGAAAEEIITRHGWPFRSVIGESAAMHLSALVAHADERNTFRRKALKAMSVTVEAGEADPRHFAHIYDRTCAVAREPQLYGSLIAPKDGDGIVIWPVQDPEQLDARRRGIGLPPLSQDIGLYRRGAVMGPFMVPTPAGDGC
jgi:hypothetical protein